MSVDSPLRYLRIGAVLVFALLAIPFLSGFLASPSSTGPSIAGSGEHATVVTVDALGPSQIVTYGPNGSLLYRNDTHGIYHDVDPSPVGEDTVTYVASDGQLPASLCEADSRCMRNVIERVNLTTGEVTRLYTRYSTNTGSTQIHDVDRVNDSVFLVADIVFPDGVYMVNTTTGERIWQWNVSAAYEPESGGRYPNDWTHINDVAYLEDGRVMANLRNQDQVVFIDPGRGVLENWTLGEDGGHDVLYEQHNPDYIPASEGGPALLVADSENDRIVEYQRTDGAWERSWTWSDPTLSWPRDADRLPNGKTLLVDSHGQRLLEVNRNGAVVWEESFPNGGYDAERLGTGDESAGGHSMRRLRADGDAVTAGGTGAGCGTLAGCLEASLTDLAPSLLLHGVLFALPDPVTPLGGVAFMLGVVLLFLWAGVEAFVRRGRLIDRLG